MVEEIMIRTDDTYSWTKNSIITDLYAVKAGHVTTWAYRKTSAHANSYLHLFGSDHRTCKMY